MQRREPLWDSYSRVALRCYEREPQLKCVYDASSFRRPRPRVDLHCYGTQTSNSQQRDDLMRIILEAQADLISANNSERGEMTGGAQDTVRQLTLGNRLLPLGKCSRERLHSSVPKNWLGQIHG